MSTAEKPKMTKYYVHSVIGVAIMILFCLLPAYDPITPIGMRVIGIFIGMCYLWTTVDMIWPSVLGIAALALSGYASVTEVLGISFGAEAVWMSVFAMAIMNANRNDLMNDHIIAAFLGSKAINGRPWLFTIIFFVAVSVFCSCINSSVGYFLFLAILADFAKRFGFITGDNYFVVMLVGVLAIGLMAGKFLPFRGMGMVVF